MPINALDTDVVRAIGATSVISDACAAVKELIDNALDASATSITIEIAANTVDSIQVKDNGHGIPSADRSLVCMQSCTSKLQTLDELQHIGSSSLGFRGEALASIAELSGSITVLTRVGDEKVGSSSSYGRDGTLLRTEKAAHPMGTTVRVVDFAKFVPVRREYALKNSSKTIKKIQMLVRDYCLARPHVRFMFKVVRSRDDVRFKAGVMDWSYIPNDAAQLAGAANQAFSRDMTSQCYGIQYPDCSSFCESSETMSTPRLDAESRTRIVMDSYLARRDAVISKVNGGGLHVSVDGRPLAASGTFVREIGRQYKKYLRSAAAQSQTSLTDPLLCLRITCPAGSYDANVEPGKDDVLFDNMAELNALLEKMFTSIYGLLPEAPSHVQTPMREKSRIVQSQNSFDLLLAKRSKQPDDRPSQDEHAEIIDGRAASPIPNQAKTNLTRINRSTSPFRTTSPDPRSPCTIQESSPVVEMIGPPIQRRKVVPLSRVPATIHRPPGPRAMNSTPTRYNSSALDTWVRKPTPNVSDVSSPTDGDIDDSEELLSQEEVGSDRSLERTNASLRAKMDVKTITGFPASDGQRWIQKPFVSPLIKDGQRNSGEISNLSGSMIDTSSARGLSQLTPPSTRHQISAHYPTPQSTSKEVPAMRRPLEQPLNLDLAEVMEFEHRKKAAIHKRKLEMQRRLKNAVPNIGTADSESDASGATHAVKKLPHVNRYLAAKANLNNSSSQLFSPPSTQMHESTQLSFSSPAGLPESDPRGYAIMHSTSIPANPSKNTPAYSSKRRMTSRLPLEQVPTGKGLHSLESTEVCDIELLTNYTTVLEKTDDTLMSFNEADSDDCSSLETTTLTAAMAMKWQSSIADLIRNSLGSDLYLEEIVKLLDLNILQSIQVHQNVRSGKS